MEPPWLAELNATRDLSRQGFRAACYAPFTSLYFDTLGGVRACCQNSEHLLGHVGRQSLDEIWRGAQARVLREALRAGDLSRGCRFCHWEIEERNWNGVFLRNFDVLSAIDPAPPWPVQMEFSLSNTCNLQCVMCNGEWSSLIRTQREHLPPLPKAYGDSFFADLRKYLPHLQRAKFYGGEPFLAAESFRIWDMMIEDGLATPCYVTTNATQYHDRVERVLERLPVSIVVSLDGATAETVERVRQGARFDEVMRHVERFRQYTRERGTHFGWAFCLMRQNWGELADCLLRADALDCELVVNTVTYPRSASLFSLSHAELIEVVRGLESRQAELERTLGRNRGVWEAELHRLRQRCQTMQGEQPYVAPIWVGHEGCRDENSRAAIAARAREALTRLHGADGIDALDCDRDDVIEGGGPGAVAFLGVSLDELRGLTLPLLQHRLGRQYGPAVELVHEARHAGWQEHVLRLGGADGATTYVAAITLPRFDADGTPLGSTILATRLAVAPATPLLVDAPTDGSDAQPG